ncbi:hypothetical protein CBS101457_006705 [Exobasidium rhododendri]|nr:hypothetical protein CBS101457_006705 [Exobasidium rhododendri]
MISTQQVPLEHRSPLLERPHSTAIPVKIAKQKTDVNHFTRWRPLFHMIAPKNWMNDPCGPCFDPQTGDFHLLYQYNPKGATWGNMSWQHATSKNLVHWKHISDEPSLVPSLPHDIEGIFSGCMLTQGPLGEQGVLTAVYTAISHLPIHFTRPYHWGSEKLALAVSTDGGIKWQRDHSSLILPSPPTEHMGDVISWRDPYIAAWPEMDEQLGLEKDTFLFGLISGGLKDKTPTAFLYKIPCNNLKSWTFISTVADVGLNFRLDEKNGEMGQNWEVCNFFSLQQQPFLLLNVEGVGHDKKGRHAMWCAVEMKGSQLVPQTSGLIDHGCLYAATTFLHGPTQRRILWGWITEDDLAESRYQQQGWSGCMSLPRELVSLTYEGVHKDVLQDSFVVSSFQIQEERGDSLQLTTLGWRPVEETKLLRVGARHFAIDRPSANRLPIYSRNFELELECTIDGAYREATEDHHEIGILLCHSRSLSQYTKCMYSNGFIKVTRTQSTMDADVCTATIVAPIKLLPFAGGTMETIRMHLFLDNSVLEVYVNDRIAITTRIYCDDDDSVHATLFNAKPEYAQFLRVEAWVNLQAAMIGETLEDER